jgi:hypothetical protein
VLVTIVYKCYKNYDILYKQLEKNHYIRKS